MPDSNEMDKIVIGAKIKELQQEQKEKVLLKRKREMKAMLQRLAFQIFLLVADADDEIDTKEINEFRKFLSERENHCSNPYTRRIFHSTVINYNALLDAYNKKRLKKDIHLVEKAMAYVQKCLSKKQMESFCHDLRDLATSIAEASGGFIGMGNHVSTEERGMIKQLEKIFTKSIENATGSEEKKIEIL